MSDAMIRARGVRKTYTRAGETLTVLDGLDLEMEEGRIGATLALEVVANGAIGHYGYGPDASAPLPPHSS